MKKRNSFNGSIYLSLGLGALFALGCGEATETAGNSGAPFFSSGGMTAAGQGGVGGAAGAAGIGGNAGIAGIGGAGVGGTGGSPGSAGRASIGTTAMPCDVNEAVQRNCQSCHGAQPLAGVPMALVSWEDFQAPAISNPSLKVYQLSDMRVHSATAPMPPAPQVIPAEDKGALESWLAGGAAMGSDPSCAPGGIVDPPDELPPDAECYELLAHNGDKTTPYQVNGEDYVNFFFDAPWPEDAQGISFESVFDDHPEVIHHWLLYLEPPPLFEGETDGLVQPLASGAHIAATLIAGWAPGGNNGMGLPPDVGMDINGPARKLAMEIHFYANAPTPSRSGVRVCTTRTPRPNVATVSWLGTESISVPAGQMATASGKCTPVSQQPIHILRSWPHMHKLGRHMTTVINRSGGGTEMLVDEPFNFNTQISYDTPATLMPGDTLTTTCTFQNDTSSLVLYGTHTDDEMCFNFVTAWPAGALAGGMAKNGAQNPCMDTAYGF